MPELLAGSYISEAGESRPRVTGIIFIMESEMLFLLVLALIVLGPRRLPEIGRQLGKALAELRRAKNEFTAQIEDEVRRLDVVEQQKKLEQTSAEPSVAANAGTANKIKPPSAP